jgi:DNA-binding NarL/FixJ family response regulator
VTDPQPLRIIVADDQASVRQGLTLLLDGLPDVEVVAAAADGQEALELVAEHRPDAVLLDLHMPVLDGIEATLRLTRDFPNVAIVVLTTYADDRSVRDALRAGARSYMTKDADQATSPVRCTPPRAASPCSIHAFTTRCWHRRRRHPTHRHRTGSQHARSRSWR